MNIFENKKDLFGNIENKVTETTLLSVFQLAKQIQILLGKQAYLLDCYLSIFFEAVSNVLASDAANKGFIQNNKMQKFFFDFFEQFTQKENNPLYEKEKELFGNQAHKLPYQEQCTKVCLLMVMIADDLMTYSVAHFVEEEEKQLCEMVDEVRMRNLYNQISDIVGESMMEELNLQLKKRFLVAPAAMIFAQGMNNDLLYRLTTRDEETSKQIFQLFLDNLTEYSK